MSIADYLLDSQDESIFDDNPEYIPFSKRKKKLSQSDIDSLDKEEIPRSRIIREGPTYVEIDKYGNTM